MTGRLVEHLGSAFSQGPGYERTPIGQQWAIDAVRGYYLDFSAKTRAETATQPDRLLPAGLAQLALGWWARFEEGDEPAEQRFLETVSELVSRSAVDDDARVWRYPIPLPKFRLESGWISALAQAQAASVLVRAYLHTGEAHYSAMALDATKPLLRLTNPSVVASLPDGPALEECPCRPPSLILNGWIYALWGLRDVATGLGSAEAAAQCASSESCLAAMLGRYDSGWWSCYSLFPFRLPDLAKAFYHRLHIDQLRVLARLTGNPGFDACATRWASYDTPLNRMRLVAQKAAFVASRYR